MTHTTFDSVIARIGQLDWPQLVRQLDERGFAVTEPVLSPEECAGLADLFDGDGFRSTIDMARHRFGDGRYRDFAYPLPELIDGARVAFYEQLAPVANRWADLLSGEKPTFPLTHELLLARYEAPGRHDQRR